MAGTQYHRHSVPSLVASASSAHGNDFQTPYGHERSNRYWCRQYSPPGERRLPPHAHPSVAYRPEHPITAAVQQSHPAASPAAEVRPLGTHRSVSPTSLSPPDHRLTPQPISYSPEIGADASSDGSSSVDGTVDSDNGSGYTGRIRKYVCSFENCGKSFTTSGHLTRHMRSHASVKPFACAVPGCTSRFTRQDNMMAHYRQHMQKISQGNEDSLNATDSTSPPASTGTKRRDRLEQSNPYPRISPKRTLAPSSSQVAARQQEDTHSSLKGPEEQANRDQVATTSTAASHPLEQAPPLSPAPPPQPHPPPAPYPPYPSPVSYVASGPPHRHCVCGAYPNPYYPPNVTQWDPSLPPVTSNYPPSCPPAAMPYSEPPPVSQSSGPPTQTPDYFSYHPERPYISGHAPYPQPAGQVAYRPAPMAEEKRSQSPAGQPPCSPADPSAMPTPPLASRHVLVHPPAPVRPPPPNWGPFPAPPNPAKPPHSAESTGAVAPAGPAPYGPPAHPHVKPPFHPSPSGKDQQVQPFLAPNPPTEYYPYSQPGYHPHPPPVSTHDPNQSFPEYAGYTHPHYAYYHGHHPYGGYAYPTYPPHPGHYARWQSPHY
ncbi:uncharacterized protein SPPG_06645 [Spizellomyces punctatus DAOM BR117]|uniref:C2H2-type domain-containing protein n=2 Tax=Spizellomyces punctatus (strain DAOM BR117) TaxID=645134 RepID=A0A0L0HBD6_SPIPD|nr:uncharacterized protein SPPG_06645 [Spizellomyces punctatus DAOM BR117]KNC98246.1 hypothetical protein SPPG_06645 [Spizellomyces punctatus DAOM BR117]|eukprot:XP_016606286.1 hypothetical protein SPPG_06645 [Spizellomyces punctatus DAOM BR117]